MDGATAFAGLDTQGLLLKGYEPNVTFNSLGTASVPSDKSYVPTGVTIMGIVAYNKAKVPSPPTTWQALESSSWKGQVGMNDPSQSGPTFPLIAGVYNYLGSDGTLEITAPAGTAGTLPALRPGGDAGKALRPGDEAVLAIRPTGVRLASLTDGSPHLTGRVADVAFRGRGYEYAIDLPGLGRLAGVFARHRATRGDEVGLRLEPDGCHLFPADDSGTSAVREYASA